MDEKMKDEDLKEVSGGSTYDCDWEVTCTCGTKITFYGFKQVVYCWKCHHPIYVVHGEGNPKQVDKASTHESAT